MPGGRGGPSSAAEPPLVCPTNPAIMIPGIGEDGALYPIEKIKAHVDGTHHLAVSVFVFCGDELLIQRRAEEKYHSGGQWANTCCTHPHWGEDAADAARRRVLEELGFEINAEERRVVDYSADVGGGMWEKERVHLFRADVDKRDVKIAPNPSEVCDIRWITASVLRQDMQSRPDVYTPWFKIYMQRFPQLKF